MSRRWIVLIEVQKLFSKIIERFRVLIKVFKVEYSLWLRQIILLKIRVEPRSRRPKVWNSSAHTNSRPSDHRNFLKLSILQPMNKFLISKFLLSPFLQHSIILFFFLLLICLPLFLSKFCHFLGLFVVFCIIGDIFFLCCTTLGSFGPSLDSFFS